MSLGPPQGEPSLANQDVRWMLTIMQMVNRKKKHKENIVLEKI